MPNEEPTVQVPESLIKMAVHYLGRGGFRALTGQLQDALLSQTPTAGTGRVVITRDQIENGVREVIEDGEWSDADDLPPLIVNAILFRSRCLPTAEPKPLNPEAVQRVLDYHGWPPRIEDMSPGTTFRAKHVDPEECGNEMRTWFVFGLRRAILFNDWGQRWSVDSIDPSTIRDVTPPKEQP